MISPVKIWRRQKDIRESLEKIGRIITWTKIFVAPPQFKKYAPYVSVLVEFGPGKRIYGQLVDYKDSDLKMGRKVISVLRRVRTPSEEGVIAYGIKFRPLS